jgi:hypothetical protein
VYLRVNMLSNATSLACTWVCEEDENGQRYFVSYLGMERSRYLSCQSHDFPCSAPGALYRAMRCSLFLSSNIFCNEFQITMYLRCQESLS